MPIFPAEDPSVGGGGGGFGPPGASPPGLPPGGFGFGNPQLFGGFGPGAQATLSRRRFAMPGYADWSMGGQQGQSPVIGGQSGAGWYSGGSGAMPMGGQPNAYNYQEPTFSPGWYPNANEYSLGNYQILHRLINAGYFDPRGNQQLIAAGGMNASRIGQALQRQAMLASQAGGLDPAQRGFGYLSGVLGGQGAQANAWNKALMDAWQQQANFGNQLALGSLGLSRPEQQGQYPSAGSQIAGGAGQAGGAAAIAALLKFLA